MLRVFLISLLMACLGIGSAAAQTKPGADVPDEPNPPAGRSALTPDPEWEADALRMLDFVQTEEVIAARQSYVENHLATRQPRCSRPVVLERRDPPAVMFEGYPPIEFAEGAVRPTNARWVSTMDQDRCGEEIDETYRMQIADGGEITFTLMEHQPILLLTYITRAEDGSANPAYLVQTRTGMLMDGYRRSRRPPPMEVEHNYPGDDDEDMFD